MKKTQATIFQGLVCFLCAIQSAAATDLSRGKSNMSDTSICNLDRIYNVDFTYSLPRPGLASFLSGKAFDNKEEYSAEELARLHEDIAQIYQSVMTSDVSKELIAAMTAGAPGAGKTTLMEQDLAKNLLEGKKYGYIDPDAVCLKNQTRTYKVDVENNPSIGGRLAAYNKWRPASNAANHIILANLIREKCGFYYGMTSTSPFTGKFFEFLKMQGYRIRLMHVSASDEVRFESIQERDKTFLQATKEDVREKGLLLPQRINDTFIKYADTIEFYWRDGVKEEAKLAATWIRNVDQSEKLGTLKVMDENLYEKIKATHAKAVEVLQRQSDLDWKRSVEDKSNLILSRN
ncbi:MAG: zeta toxin family protein [Chlamydiota bacterium]